MYNLLFSAVKLFTIFFSFVKGFLCLEQKFEDKINFYPASSFLKNGKYECN